MTSRPVSAVNDVERKCRDDVDGAAAAAVHACSSLEMTLVALLARQRHQCRDSTGG